MKTENLVNKLCTIYLVLMFTIPLFIFNDYYYDITITKYKAFSYITLVSLLFIFITFIVLMIKKKAIKLNLKELSQHISKTDLCLILFVLTCIFSTVFSANSTEAWNGSLGRYMGLYSILLCAGSYFVVSRFYKLQQSILLVFLVSVFLVELLGVFHYFSVDVFGFYEYLSDYYGNLYISTIGNVNFFAALTCLSLPFGIVLYCAAKERLSNIIYFILTVMNYLAVFISNSDGAHIASVIMLIVIGLYAMSNYEYFKKYLQLLAAYIVSAKLLGLLTMQIGTGHFLHTISSVLAYHPSVYLILLTIGVIYSLLVYKKAVFMSEQNMKKIKSIFCKYVFIGFVLLLIIIILYNMEILKPYMSDIRFWNSYFDGSLDLDKLDNFNKLVEDKSKNDDFIKNCTNEVKEAWNIAKNMTGTDPLGLYVNGEIEYFSEYLKQMLVNYLLGTDTNVLGTTKEEALNFAKSAVEFINNMEKDTISSSYKEFKTNEKNFWKKFISYLE